MIRIPGEFIENFEILPGRTLRHGKHGKHVTCIFSRKNKCIRTCETLLETDLCLELERSLTIVSYQTQPFTLAVKRGKIKYTPDFSVLLKDGSTVIYEIKPDTALKDSVTMTRLLNLKIIFATCGYLFEVIRESQFRHPIKTYNLQRLYHTSSDATLTSAKPTIDIVNTSNKALKVQDLLGRSQSASDIAFSVFYGHINADLSLPFNSQTILKPR
ncbi:Tn7 transposase TnsA N-terminal domain-containing protein [Pseudomonas pseudonitroreducens]|uniref:Tn7 transposase TnsA N-terminal domain-containing protein n=1 Tax=Pseudomonas pseudonitroreducens TaxID=2892326 RepID=UPI001F285110|nr:Tn7 transposase TnsA N-terminal domain-containing protein [Pseudomonas pseudonitroreducens]